MSELRIKKTKQYSMFKLLKGNRVINQSHVESLVKSMKQKFLISPIQVNENFEVIDGQHRLEAIKRLGYDCHYVVVDGANIETVQSLNANSKNWSTKDYVECYAALGKRNYQLFLDFCNEFDTTVDIGFHVCNIAHGGIRQQVMAGNMGIPNYEKAYEFAAKLKRIKIFYPSCWRRGFIIALRKCMNKPGFDVDDFIDKLSFQSLKMRDCTTTDQYVDLIEMIYNYKRSEKLNLRID